MKEIHASQDPGNGQLRPSPGGELIRGAEKNAGGGICRDFGAGSDFRRGRRVLILWVGALKLILWLGDPKPGCAVAGETALLQELLIDSVDKPANALVLPRCFVA